MLLLNFLTSVSVITLSGLLSFGTSTFMWNPTNEWTPCSKICDKGEETQNFVCLKRTNYRTYEYANSNKCQMDKYPKKTRPCFLGRCPQNSTGTFVWQVGNWSSCQKNCGGDGSQFRDVNCIMITSKGQFLSSKLSKCDNKFEPPRFISCGHADCPPKFLTSKWHKCSESSDCRPSIRRRDVKCVTIKGDGKVKIQSPGVCYRMNERPPSSWMICHSKTNQHCLEIKKENKKQNSKIEIKTDNSEIHQMRHTKRLKILVGQTAYVLGFTRLSIFCPMPIMHRSKIKWQHGNNTYEYHGISRERIRVNRKGVLVIREFYLIDSGEWICKAGRYTAKATLHLEQPSTGFDNWLKRHANHNYGMLNEESNFSFIRPESIIWIKSDWSPCSTTCEGNSKNAGYQTRKVTCEKIEAQYYKIIEDKFCPPLKPITIKKCKSFERCPKWIVEKNDNEQCSDVCVNIGLARTSTNIVCQFNNRTVDSSLCDSQKLPNITCLNDKCQISYNYGPWSQCSLSCSNTTNASIRSRTMKCIWKHTNKPAYNLCQLQQLPHRSLTKPCRVPKCILGCKDLTPACVKQSKYRCRSSLFNHFCCAFCNKQFS